MKKTLVAGFVLWLVPLAFAQNGRAILDAAQSAMGITTMTSMYVDAHGTLADTGSAAGGNAPRPIVKSYAADVHTAPLAMRLLVHRTNPDGTALVTGTVELQFVSGTYAWDIEGTTGVREIQQIFQLCPGYGTIVTTGVRWGGVDIPIPSVSLTNAGKRLIQGQYGGTGLMRDVPRMVNMMERGQYKWQRIVSAEYPLEQARQALEDAAYRTKISAHVVFDPAPFLRS